ncbi:MAG: hypothetical protein U9Q07_00420 [Planctomycetota bacterium]|nr:hypothetical protein [Planctomycetota bacterium]
MPELRLEAFKAGLQTDSEGRTAFYPQRKLDEWARNFVVVRKAGFQPPLKLGHRDAQEFAMALTGQRGLIGAPALGWIDGVAIDGDKFMTDLEKIHPKVLELWKRGSYGPVSAEIGRVNLSDGSSLETIIGLSLEGHNRTAVKELAHAFTEGEVRPTFTVEPIDLFTAKGDADSRSPDNNSHEGGIIVPDEKSTPKLLASTPKTFTEADIKRVVSEALAKKDAEFTEREKAIQARFTTELLRKEALRDFSEAMSSPTQFGVLPLSALKDAGLDALAVAVAGVETLKFTDAAGAEQAKSPLEALGNVVATAAALGYQRLGERIGTHGDKATRLPTDPVERAFAEARAKARKVKPEGDLTYDDLREHWEVIE